MTRFAVVLMLLFQVPLVRAETPVTDREQTLAFTADAVNREAAAAYNRTIAGYRRHGLLDHNPKELAEIRAIASRIIAQAVKLKPEAARWSWEIHTTNAKDVSAYCMAGGKILVGSRFVDAFELSKDELAIVLAHEIGHAIAEHVREQLSAVMKRHPRWPRNNLADAIAAMDGNMADYLALMPLSRAQEIEADQIGVRLAAMAGFRPTAALTFYAKLAHAEAQSGATVFETHASGALRERIAPALIADSRPFYLNAADGRRLPTYTFSAAAR